MLVASKVASRIGLLVFVPTLLLVGCGSRNLIETFCSFDFSTSREDAIRTLGEPHVDSVEDGFVWYFRDKGVLDFEVLDATADVENQPGRLEIWFDRGRPTLMRWVAPYSPGLWDFNDDGNLIDADIEKLQDFEKNQPCHPNRECYVDDEDMNRTYKESIPEQLIPGCEVVDTRN